MKTWFKEYRDTMYRTRAIGVVGAGSVVAAVVLEVLRIFKALSIAEGPFEKDLMSSPTYQCVEESGRVCFGIYEMSRSADLVVLSGLLFMLLGILRAVVTGVCAATKYSYK